MASGFRNSTHCSTPTREGNAPTETAANKRPPGSCNTRPPAYINGSAVSRAATGTISQSLIQEPGDGFTLFNLSFQPSFILFT